MPDETEQSSSTLDAKLQPNTYSRVSLYHS